MWSRSEKLTTQLTVHGELAMSCICFGDVKHCCIATGFAFAWHCVLANTKWLMATDLLRRYNIVCILLLSLGAVMQQQQHEPLVGTCQLGA